MIDKCTENNTWVFTKIKVIWQKFMRRRSIRSIWASHIKASANSQLIKENVFNLSYRIIKRFYEIISKA